jgi:hypothetical protein
MLDGVRGGALGAPPSEGGFEEDVGVETTASRSVPPARGRTPVDDLDDDIPF